MALTNDQIMALNFKDFYEALLPYLNGAPTSADDIFYSNDDSHLTAETVQDAIDEVNGKVDDKQTVIQFSTMPTASSTLSGKIVQYIGTTTSSYTKGFFYECVESSGNYIWQKASTNALANSNNPGFIPALSGDSNQALRGDGTWGTVSSGSSVKVGTTKSGATQTNLYFIHS